MSLRVDITLDSTVAWARITCDHPGCAATGPLEAIASDEDHWGYAMAHARAASEGFRERIEGRMLRSYCPTHRPTERSV